MRWLKRLPYALLYYAKTGDKAYISYYRDDEYLEALNDMNIHSFIIGSPAYKCYFHVTLRCCTVTSDSLILPSRRVDVITPLKMTLDHPYPNNGPASLCLRCFDLF